MEKLLKSKGAAIFFSSCGINLDKITDHGLAVCSASALVHVTAHIRLSSFVGVAGLIFITGFSTYDNKTAVIYHYNTKEVGRITLISLVDSTKTVGTVRHLYYNSWWYERETSEMFGVIFKNSTDTRNLLLQYGSSEHPLKKTISSDAGRWVIDAQNIGFVLKNVI